MFARRSQLDDLIDKATSELLTSEDWNQIMIICDMVPRVENGPRDCANAILRRINQKNAKVSCYAITVAEACVKNCGLLFHREISSSNFLNPIIKMVLDRANTHFSVRERLLTFIQDCARDFAYDHTLGLMDSEYRNLVRQGVEFPSKTKQPEVNQKDLQKEEEELQLALALSMSEAESKKKQASAISAVEPKKKSPPPTPKNEGGEITVKALYDFAGADRGELGFKKGDLVIVLEKTHSGWWKGKLKHRPEATGLFPSNYVAEVSSEGSSAPARKASEDPEEHIPTESIDRLYELLLAINPQKDNIAKNDTIQELFQQCNEIRPKILQLIVKYEKKKNDLIQLNDLFSKSKATYEKLLAASVAQRQVPPRDYGLPPQGLAPPGAIPQIYAPPAYSTPGGALPPSQQPSYSPLPPPQQHPQEPYFAPAPSYPQYSPAPAAAPPSTPSLERSAPLPQSYQYPGYAPPHSGSFTPNAPPSSDYPSDPNYFNPSQAYDAPKDPSSTVSFPSTPAYYQEPPSSSAPPPSSSSSSSIPLSSAPLPSSSSSSSSSNPQPYYSSPSYYPPPSSSAPSGVPPQDPNYGSYQAPPPPLSSPSPSPYPSSSAPLPQGQYGFQQQQQPYGYPQQQYPPVKQQEVSLIDLS